MLRCGAGSAGIVVGRACKTAAATARSSISALASLPGTTATRTGALPTARPVWFSVVTAYCPGAAFVSKFPFVPEVVADHVAGLEIDERHFDALEGTALQRDDALDRPQRGAADTTASGGLTRRASEDGRHSLAHESVLSEDHQLG